MDGDIIVNYAAVETFVNTANHIISLIEDLESKGIDIREELEIRTNKQEIVYFGQAYENVTGYIDCLNDNFRNLSAYVTYVKQYLNLVVEATKAEDQAIKEINKKDKIVISDN